MVINDVIVPFHPKDKNLVMRCCASLLDVVGAKRIFLISHADPHIEGTTFIPESSLTNIVSKSEIQKIVGKHGFAYYKRAGWLYQQLIKLGADDFIEDLSDGYMVCDSDIIFLTNPYRVISELTLPYSQNFLNELHEPYFRYFKKLTGISETAGFSFINHHMIFKRQIIRSLKDLIELKFNRRWDLAIIENLSYDHPSNFSEYETYGNWVYAHHLKLMRRVQLKVLDIDYIPTKEEENLFAKDYDILSCQAWKRGNSSINYFDLFFYKMMRFMS
jgi:hypothetical protein